MLNMQQLMLTNAGLTLNPLSRMLSTLQLICSSRLKSMIIEGDFWISFLDIEIKNRSTAVQSVLSILDAAGLRHEIISFYLAVPRLIAEEQLNKRTKAKRPYLRINSETTPSGTALAGESDKKYNDFISSISTNCPFFHVIDGTLPIEDVTNHILAKLSDYDVNRIPSG